MSLKISEAINNLREELMVSINSGKDEDLKFEVNSIEMELGIELEASAKGKIDAKWVVVSVGGEAGGKRTSTHKVKLTMTPKGYENETVKISSNSSRPK